MNNSPRKYNPPLTGPALCLGVLLILAVAVTSAAAQESYPGDPGDETSAFANPAQAQRAENLAMASALEADPAVAEALESALAELDAAEATGDPAAIDAARDKVDATIAEAGGVTTAEIADMRESGNGWGEIAHELGLHPSTLGLGQAKGALNRDRRGRMSGFSGALADDEGLPTARNLRTGWAKGHGLSAKDGSGTGTGKGLGKDDAPGQSKDKSDKGDKGDKGGGQGGDKGGGQGGGSGKK